MRIVRLSLPLLAAFTLPLATATGCGDDTLEGTEGVSEGETVDSTEGSTDPSAGPTSGTTDDPAGSDSDNSTTGTTTATTTTSPTSNTDSDTDTDSGTDTDDLPPTPYDGPPLPDADPGAWTWVEFPEAHCRNGNPTGIGVRYGTVDKLMIYFEGGGACFNALTCVTNPGGYSQDQFNGWANGGGHNGIFNPENGDNPVADWHHIYVPYCTGDVHAGSNPNGNVLGPQEFVGFTNVGHFLERIVPTFYYDVEHVLVTGISAGGFGAAVNYDRIADAFPQRDVTLVDDSGPPFADAYLAPCLQQQWRDIWGLNDTFPAECTECFPQDGGGIYNLATYLGEKHANQKLGLISATADNVIRLFFGYGYTGPNQNGCPDPLFPPSMEAWFFEDGLYDLRDNVLDESPVWASYVITSDSHTWIGGNGTLYSTEVSGVLLIDWISDLLEGESQHVAP